MGRPPEEIMRKAISSLVALTVLGISSAASAQYGGGYSSGTYQTTMPSRSSDVDNIGNDGQFVFGVDRTMGIFFDRTTVTVDNPAPIGSVDTTTKQTTIALFGVASDSYGAIPRLALDYFIASGFSIGGSLLFNSQSSTMSLDPDPANVGDQDGPTTTTFAFAPRVGYGYAFDETFSIWPRAGITYVSSKTETKTVQVGAPTVTDTTTASGLDLSAEVMLGISPFSNFAFLVGPYLDLGLSGTIKNEQSGGATATPSTENDAKFTSYGLAVSVVGYY